MGEYYLVHHGIKGQKWGVRRGPPYPIEDKTLAKATRLNSVSYSSKKGFSDNKRWVYTYNPNDEWDSKVYKGPFSVYKTISSITGRDPIYEHQYETIKDLKMPTSKERIDEFINLYKKKPAVATRELSGVQRYARVYNVGTKEAQNVNLRKLKTDADYKAAYELFNHAMENVNRYKTTKAYAEMMSEKYDAMVDDNNRGIYNKAHDPIIIFRANEVLKEIGDVKQVTLEEITRNFNDVRKELAKEGEKVKL